MVKRGCFDGVMDTNSTKDKIVTCRTHYCNTHMFVMGSCMNCTSDLNGNCSTGFKFLSAKEFDPDSDNAIDYHCPIMYEVPLCYTIFDGNFIERGCTAKLYHYKYDRECGPRKTCYYCDTDLCNYWRQVPAGYMGWRDKHYPDISRGLAIVPHLLNIVIIMNKELFI